MAGKVDAKAKASTEANAKTKAKAGPSAPLKSTSLGMTPLGWDRATAKQNQVQKQMQRQTQVLRLHRTVMLSGFAQDDSFMVGWVEQKQGQMQVQVQKQTRVLRLHRTVMLSGFAQDDTFYGWVGVARARANASASASAKTDAGPSTAPDGDAVRLRSG